jgi:SAM-dependent methyltransferase
MSDSPRVNESNFRPQTAASSHDVLKFYDNYAEAWDERFGDQASTRDFHRIRLGSFLDLADLRTDQRVVEIGVGTGVYLPFIAPHVREVICIDGSRRMLEVLTAKHTGLKNLTVLQKDLEQNLGDIAFDADLVYCFGLLEHIINVDRFLENCRRMLKPSGRLIVVAPNGRSPWYGPIRRLWRAGSHCSSDRYYTEKSSNALFARFGFSPIGARYWGYAPAGAGNLTYRLLSGIGKILDHTPLRYYAGGLTLGYRRDK